MAKWAGAFPSWTPVAVADTTAYTDSGYHALQGGSASQRIELREIFLGGLAGASAPALLFLGRDSTVGATLTAGRLAALNPDAAAPSGQATSFQVSTTKPQRSATEGMLQALGFNAFGGIVRWVNGPDELIGLRGNAASDGELSISAFTGGTPGLITSSITFENFD